MEAISDRVASLEVTQSSVRVVVVGVERQMPVVHHAVEVPIGPADGLEQSPLYAACQTALGQCTDELLVSSVEATDVLVRQLKVALAKDREIDATLEFQIEPLLPFPTEEGVLDYVVLERDKVGATLAVLTLPKERLAAHLERMHAGGIEPERTSCVQAALAALLYRLLPSQETQGVLHLGDEATTCLLVRQGKVVGSRAIACGAAQLLAAAGGGRELDFHLLETGLGEKLQQRAEALRAEVSRAFFALFCSSGSQPTQIFISGQFDNLRNFDVYLANALDLPLVRLPNHSPFCGALTESMAEIMPFAVPLGLALSALPLQTPRIDFRRKEYAYPHPWRRLRRRLALYFTLCLLLAGGLLLMGRAMRTRRMNALKSEYEALSHYAWQALEDPAPAPCPNTALEIVEEARRLGARFEAMPLTYPLFPLVPRASDVLAWLSTHPALVTTDPVTGNAEAKIQLRGVQYVMESHPSPRRPSDRYRMRLELEFCADNPTTARALHDALLTTNPFVDPNTDVKWTQKRECYRASFYLRDQTYYPGSA